MSVKADMVSEFSKGIYIYSKHSGGPGKRNEDKGNQFILNVMQKNKYVAHISNHKYDLEKK
jgi:hypothetical protein